MTRTAMLEAVDAEFERVLSDRQIQTVFQPVFHLSSGAVVGYEALIRGPEGSAVRTADSLLSAAERTGRLVELDWVARASACRAASEAGLSTDHLLLLNFEPIALNTECPSDVWPDIERGFRTLRVVLEVTERSLDRDPGELLEGIERQRTQVAGIALDDVGSEPSTVSLLPLVGPNVIKIDRDVTQGDPDGHAVEVFSAVHQEAGLTGAMIIAEGIETPEHLHYALAQGAQAGQGYLLGGPGPLPKPPHRPSRRPPLLRNAPMVVASPFDALAGEIDGRAGDDLLAMVTCDLAAFAEASMPALYVSLLPGGRALPDEELQRLVRLAKSGSFTAVLGPDVPPEPGYGVRGIGDRHGSLPDNEWAAIAVGRGLSAAVLAMRAPDSDEWMYGVTHDPTRVAAAARSVVRLLGVPGSSRSL